MMPETVETTSKDISNIHALEKLTSWFDDKKKVLVALSGGVDSALVAYAAFEKLQENAVAVTADYKTLSQEELDSSGVVCSEIGISRILLKYDELENESFARNDSNRCFHCRVELGSRLVELACSQGADVIVDGTNLDDLGDYRPGIMAMRKHGIQSPLVDTDFTKKMVRNVARYVGLSVHDRPSNSCLASRIPWGQRVTSERLVRIELGENLVRQLTGIRQVRVRDIDGAARIEVETQHIPLLYDGLDEITTKLKAFGFSSVSIDQSGYRPGKINVVGD